VLVPPAGGGVGGTSGGRVADGGGRVVFQSASPTLVPGDSNGATDLFLWLRGGRSLTRVNVGPGGRQDDAGSFNPDLSDDGRWVAFCSSASNLLRRRVAGAPLAGPAIYLRDLRSGRTRMVSRHAARDLEGDLGASDAWTETYLDDRTSGGLTRVAQAPDGSQPDGHVQLFDLAGDGRWVAVGATSTLLGSPQVSPWGDVFVAGPWP
jgi:hypothetical protein